MDHARISSAHRQADTRDEPLLALAGDAQRILVVGTVAGLDVERLEDAGRTVVAVGTDVGGAAFEDLEVDVEEGAFDAVVVGEALERTPDRVAFLERVSALVAEGGCVVVTVRNATELVSRLRVLAGEPTDGRAALTHALLVDLLESSGLVPTRWRRVGTGTIEPPSAASVPAEVRTWLASDPEAATERFVVRAAVAREADRLRSLRLELDEQRAAARRREDELGAELERLRGERQSEEALRIELEAMTAREDELRAMLLDAHDQAMRRDDELARRARSRVELQPRLPVMKHKFVTRFPRAAAVYRRFKRRV